MKNLEQHIKTNGFPDQEPPLGHRHRFEELLNQNFGTQIAYTPKKSSRVRRLLITLTSLAAVLTALMFILFTPSQQELMDSELEAMRQEIIDDNMQELEKLHNSILDLAKEKLSVEDYAEIQQSVSELHNNYIAIINKKDSIPLKNFEAIMRKNLNLNITTYRKITKQLAKK